MSIYHYFAGCIPHLQVVVEKIRSTHEYTFGITAINGFLSPLFILLKGVGIISKTPYLSSVASKYIVLPETPSVVGNGVGMRI